LQSITSMAFTLGAPLGAIWGGAAVDRFGLEALWVGAGLLALVSLGVLVSRRSIEQAVERKRAEAGKSGPGSQ
jgi:predicted MFS family arabinose efflux permease